MPDIADYDRSGYDYTKYWGDRTYENAVEHRALRKLLPAHGRHLLDVGGGFGRLTDVYYPRFAHSTILDYSKESLAKVQMTKEQKNWVNLDTAVGDVYRLPFADRTFDCVIMIRVMHHLERPDLALTEIARVLEPSGILVLEMANKIHLKAVLRAFSKGQWRFRSDLAPLKISNLKSPISNLQPGIFYNFHPRQIEQLLAQHNLTVQKKLSVSNLRLPVLKQLLPTPLLQTLDTAVQPFFTHFSWGPSIWFQCQKT